MKTSRRILLAGILGLGAMSAWAMPHMGAHKQEAMPEAFMDYLQLNDEQRQAVQALMKEKRELQQQAREDKQKPMQALQQLDPESATYQADLQALIQAQQTKVAQKLQAHADLRARMYQILDDQQEVRLEAWQAARAAQKQMRGAYKQEGDSNRGYHHKGERRCDD
ncbi:hypothetical protein SAMN05421831_102304 [Allopseudospirillum japonicum]|uniref:Periplasmic heavy metal sensor n=1 Tax=Allopseudospirillum japonicum TaxID=64971 RepID=A0A1H6R7H9_9GAMM|nr:hypothetical protein [Allopseudospirillum japonicum]SEI48487.1 hypothetical protein SAMN05421831_102304 [Allopseudospirillum japonicum]